MTNEKGITLISLVTTIIIMIILAAVAVNYGISSIETAKLQNFNYELQQVKGKVNTIFEKIKLGEEDYIILGSNITESSDAVNTLKAVKNIDYGSLSEEDRENYYYKDDYTTYRYLTEAQVQELFDITSNPGDMIINFQTTEVISVYGFEYKGNTYYTLSDFNNTYESVENIIINQTANYVTDGLMLYYDGENNTGYGHNNDASIWKDLSGNGNNAVFQNSTWGENGLILSGTNSKAVTSGEINFNSNCTFEVVFKSESSQGFILDARISGNNVQNQGYQPAYIVSSNSIQVATGTSGPNTNVGKQITGSTHAITIVYSSDSTNLYVDGELVQGMPLTSVKGTEYNSKLYIGIRHTGTAAIKGIIFSCRYYNRCLTENEIRNNYQLDNAKYGIENS